LDEKGDPIKVGLKREDGNPNLDRRVMDGFGVSVSGTTLIVSYHSEITLKDVYGTKFEDELEQKMADIVKFLKKNYKMITGNSLGLKALGEVDALVQKTSKVRCFVTCKKLYSIAGMDDTVNVREASEDNLDKNFKNFLQQGGWGGSKRPNNDNRKASDG